MNQMATENNNGQTPIVVVRQKKCTRVLNRETAALHRVSTISNGPSRARVGISHLSVPLAWNSDEYFGGRGSTEGRIFSMFVVAQASNNVIDSRIVAAVDRTCTDVTFTDNFIFENQPVDFEIELSLYSTRTDNGDFNQSLKQRLTRSLGRKFGSAYKSAWAMEDNVFGNTLNTHDGTNAGTYFHLLGTTTLTLKDAKPKTGIYDLHLSPNGSSYGPPLYGHIRCRLVAQPNSVALPLFEGFLTIKPINEDCLYQNIRCRLQAGVIRCTTKNTARNQDYEIALLYIYINKDSKVIPCMHQRSIVVTSDRYLSASKRDKQYVLTAETEEDIAAWRHAIALQIADCEYWGEFAVSSVRLTTEARPDTSTLSRENGLRLYDQIQVDGSLSGMPGILKNDTNSSHRNFVDPTKYVSFAPTTKQNQTAPTSRRRNRAHVRKLFQPSSDNSEGRYVINLLIGDCSKEMLLNSNHQENSDSCKEDYTIEQEKVTRDGNVRKSSSAQNVTRINVYNSNNIYEENFLKGFKKSFQRSFGALRNRKSSAEISRL